MEIDNNISWKNLKNQKSWLLKQDSEEAYGLLHLIDHIQDKAVEQGIAKEREVFNTTNAERVGRIEQCLECVTEYASEDYRTASIDLLTDLMHFLKDHDIAYEDVFRIAKGHFEEET